MSENESKELAILKDLMLSGNDVKRTFQDNYIKLLLQKHPTLPIEYIVDFLHKSQITGANPALDEIYLIERKTKNNDGTYKTVGSVVFNYRFFLQKSKENKDYKNVKTETGVGDYFSPVTGETTKTLFAKATVEMISGGNVSFIAWWPEFAQYKDEYIDNRKTGRRILNAQWESKPRFMLEKCALANACRWAAPNELSGMYLEEELGVVEQIEDKRTSIIEAESKNVETAKAVEQKKENSENAPEIDKEISFIKSVLQQLTEGFSATEKIKYMSEKMGIKSFKELKNKPLDYLKESASNLDCLLSEKLKNKTEEIKTSFTEKDIPWGDENAEPK